MRFDIPADVEPRFLIEKDGARAFGFWQIAALDPHRVAVVSSDERTTTAGELLSRCNRICHLLRRQGLENGDVVAVMYPNIPDMFSVALATAQVGFRIVPLNWHLTTAEIVYLLNDSGSKAVFGHDSFADTLGEAVEQTTIPAANCFANRPFGKFQGLDEALRRESDKPPADRCSGGPMYYTSGTTGRPKGVRRPVRQDVSPESALAASVPSHMDMYGISAGPGVHLVVAPLYHAAPLTRALQLLHLGHKLVLMEKWTPLRSLELIEQHAVTTVQFVPIMFHRLLQLPDEQRRKFRHDSLQAVLHAAAPCPIATKYKMIEWWGPIVHEFYAATEGGGTCVNSVDWLKRPGTVGRPFPKSRVEIRDDEDRRLPPGEVGLIYMSDGRPFEYHNDPEKTSAAIKNGFFTAGDYGYLDPEGWLFMCDRRVDLIISGGVNIYPAEVEAVLMQHPEVADAAVIGLPDEEWGQRVHAVIQLHSSSRAESALSAELLSLCRDKLATFKLPRAFTFGELPRTDGGKISRVRLRESLLKQ